MGPRSDEDDFYAPFRFAIIQDDVPSSSDDGSGLHSPVGGVFPRMPRAVQGGGESLRYQLDPQAAVAPSETPAPQFDFAQGLNENNQQQIPIPDTRLEPPNSRARQITFSQSHYFQLPPYHTGHSFVTHFAHYSSFSSRVPDTTHVAATVDFGCNPSQLGQLSPSGPSHTPPYYQRPPSTVNSTSVGADHRSNSVAIAERSDPSMPNATNNSRESRKGINPVVIACRLCRARKIRCDSTRPECNNCLRRNNECEYDAMPKRRGPDKRPGTRQRRCKKRASDDLNSPNPKRRRTTTEIVIDPPETQERRMGDPTSQSIRYPERSLDLRIDTPTLRSSPSLTPPSGAEHCVKQEESPTHRRSLVYGYEQSPFQRQAFPRSIDLSPLSNDSQRTFVYSTSPMVDARQREWWERISAVCPNPQELINEFNFLRYNTTHQLSFVHIDSLAVSLHEDSERMKIQPAFIFAGLALAQLLRSSRAEQGLMGMEKAVRLRDQANEAIDQALHAGQLHADLAKARFLLAVFETSAYTDYSDSRATAALHALDEMIRALTLTTIDVHDKAASSYTSGAVPTVFLEDGPSIAGRTCMCIPEEVNDASKNYATRNCSLPWSLNWTSNQIHEEEIRRLCWASLSLICDYTVQCAALGRDVSTFYLTDPGNFVLLFPGEAMYRLPEYKHPNDPLLVKESVWALHCRSMLLWSFCMSVKENQIPVDDKIEAFTQSIGEAQLIEDALNVHHCNIDTTIINLTREYLFNIQLLVANEVRITVAGLTRSGRPGILYNTKHVQEWVRSQQGAIQKGKDLIQRFSSVENNEFIRQPFIVPWFVNQLNIAVLIWPYEQTMVGLLELAKDLLFVVENLNALWACPDNDSKTNGFRAELMRACHSRGIAPPLPTPYAPSNI
ncbi:transcriptional regulator family: Fungal Specific TF [Agaricus bisporus var. burnettii]|uniref:Transcriptional regulator family: Fungal Specific TF n=1 Tax=Agaricus bisporus var. burnettii TaxID=192524 RepID=A0A8H7F8U2_AGABI|nr:transcriptional regulator family: Fungal Specific TF [Agaricus bisporus var. burnettii]